jgi:hypothetical protein
MSMSLTLVISLLDASCSLEAAVLGLDELGGHDDNFEVHV